MVRRVSLKTSILSTTGPLRIWTGWWRRSPVTNLTCVAYRRGSRCLGQSNTARGLNFTLVTSLGDIDLLGEIPGGGAYKDLVAGAVELHVFETRCLCLSVPQLLRAKRAAGRPRDLEALEEEDN